MFVKKVKLKPLPIDGFPYPLSIQIIPPEYLEQLWESTSENEEVAHYCSVRQKLFGEGCKGAGSRVRGRNLKPLSLLRSPCSSAFLGKNQKFLTDQYWEVAS
ncbi:MAG: hypothetical protein AB4426_26240 [Xenococcaceae cyanobacterium]